MKQHKGMRPHDVVILLKVATVQGEWMNKELADALKISQAEIGYSLGRSAIAGLIDHSKRKVMCNTLLEFIQYGLPYVFPPDRGAMTKGIPTAFSAPIMEQHIKGANVIMVWPHVKGNARGESLSPLYPNAVDVAIQDQNMYDLLALIDVMRIGKVREKQIAMELLRERLNTRVNA